MCPLSCGIGLPMGLALLRKYGNETEIAFPLFPTLYPPAHWLATHLGQHWFCEEDQREKGLDSGLVRFADQRTLCCAMGLAPETLTPAVARQTMKRVGGDGDTSQWEEAKELEGQARGKNHHDLGGRPGSCGRRMRLPCYGTGRK